MTKQKSALEQMQPDDTNVFATNMIDKYTNRPNHLENMCYADFATSYDYTKTKDTTKESEDIDSYLNPVSHILEVEPSKTKITLKNKLGDMRLRSRSSVMRYHKVTKTSDSEQYYMILLQLYLSWRNEDELKGDGHTYEEKYGQVESIIMPNILKHEPCFEKYDLDLEDLEYYDDGSESEFDEVDDDFSMINPDLLDLDSDEGSDEIGVPSTSTSVIDNQSIPRKVFYDMCSKLNEAQLELFNFISKHAYQCQLADKNDLPKPDPFYIFLSGGARCRKKLFIEHNN